MNYSALRFLHYIFAASDHGSFRRAAQALGIEASVISRRIHELENTLGFNIFERSNDGVQLTIQGSTWLAEIRPHYNALREKTICASSTTRSSHVLRVGVGTSLGKGEIVGLLRSLANDKDSANATLMDGPCSLHRTKVLQRQLDVAFIWECCSHEGCRSASLWRDRLFVCLPEGHELLAYEELKWADLQGERLLIPQGKNGPLFDPCLLERIGGARAGPAVEYRDSAQVTVLAEVMLGAGVSVTGHALARSQLPGVAWRPLTGENSVVSVKAIWLESNVKPLVQRLIVRAKNTFRNGEER